MDSPPPPSSPPSGPPPLHAQLPPGGLSQDDLNLGMLCHLLAIFSGFLGPLILWLLKKDSSPYIAFHGRESLNFQITLLVVTTVLSALAGLLMIILVGVFLIPVLGIVILGALILEIIACLAASRGELYRYPFNIRFIK